MKKTTFLLLIFIMAVNLSAEAKKMSSRREYRGNGYPIKDKEIIFDRSTLPFSNYFNAAIKNPDQEVPVKKETYILKLIKFNSELRLNSLWEIKYNSTEKRVSLFFTEKEEEAVSFIWLIILISILGVSIYDNSRRKRNKIIILVPIIASGFLLFAFNGPFITIIWAILILTVIFYGDIKMREKENLYTRWMMIRNAGLLAYYGLMAWPIIWLRFLA